MAGHIYDSCQLPDASTHIRLLHIHPTQDDGAVECTMSAHLLAEVPPFNAISYTWGEEGAIDQIIVNGQRVPVTPNCCYALWQARLNSLLHRVWIDSVCIDQENLSEKGTQVAMMFKIFQRAQQVLACVGPHHDSSHTVHAVYEETRSRFLSRFPTGISDSVSYNDWAPISKEWLDVHGAEKLQKVICAFQAFDSRRYWTRLWIVQELCAVGNTRVEVLCGESVLELVWLDELDGFIFATRMASRRYAFADSLPLSTIRRLSRLAGDGTVERISLLALLRSTASMQCTKEHDKIYSLLGLIEFPGAALPIAPDYNSNLFTVAMGLIPACYRALDPLSQVFRRTWTGCTHKSLRECGKLSSFPMPGSAHAKAEPSGWRFHCDTTIYMLFKSADGRLCAALQYHLGSRSQVNKGSKFLPGCPHDDQSIPIHTGCNISAIVCSGARAGDVIVGNCDEGYAVVLRRSSNSKLELVGQAIFVNGYRPYPFDPTGANGFAYGLTMACDLTIPLTTREAIKLVIARNHDNAGIPTPFRVDGPAVSRIVTATEHSGHVEFQRLNAFVAANAERARSDPQPLRPSEASSAVSSWEQGVQ